MVIIKVFKRTQETIISIIAIIKKYCLGKNTKKYHHLIKKHIKASEFLKLSYKL